MSTLERSAEENSAMEIGASFDFVVKERIAPD
jgi:hypothetical protein